MEILFDEKELEKIEKLFYLSEEEIDKILYYKSFPEPILKILELYKNNIKLNDKIIKLEKQLLLKEMEIDSIFELTSTSFTNFKIYNIINLLRNIIMGQIGVSKIIIFKVENENISILEKKGIKYTEEELVDNIKNILENRGKQVITEIELGQKYNLLYFPYKQRGIGIITGNRINNENLKKRDFEFIETVVTQILIILENIDLYKDFLEKERMERELQIARRIQKRMLPNKISEWNNFSIEAVNISSYEVGGDLYDFVEKNDELYITIGDVSGKGLSAALIMASSQSSIRAILSYSQSSLEEIIKRINKVLLSITKNEMYMSFVILKLKKGLDKIEYYNAGHLPAILYGKDGSFKELHKGSYILGLFERIEGKGESISLEKGDTIIMFTDGVSEFEIDNKEIGIGGVKELIRKCGGDIVTMGRELLSSAPHGRLKDDFTLLKIKHK